MFIKRSNRTSLWNIDSWTVHQQWKKNPQSSSLWWDTTFGINDCFMGKNALMHFFYNERGFQLLWGISLLFATPVIHPSLMAIHPTHIQVLHGAAIAISVMSLILNIKAVFFFKSPKKTKRSSKFQGNKLLQVNLIRSRDSIVSPEMDSSRNWICDCSVTGTYPFCHVCRFCSYDGFATGHAFQVIYSAKYALDITFRLLYCSISVACSLIAASTTHGLGGLLRHGQDGHKKEGSWRFFQPFVGGRVFIATQALGWSLFSLSLVCFIALVREIVKGVAIALKMWALASGGTAVVTQIVLGLSVFYFKPGNKEKWMFHLKRFILENLPVVLMYIPIHAICTIWVFTFTFLPMTYALLMWTLILSVYYVSTTKGHPSKTGCRKWPAFQAFIAKHIEASLKRWFGRIEVINAAGKKLDPEEKYIYGYHPHGMYPVGAGFLRILPQFREMVCEHIPTVLCATALFIPPLLRDIMCWNGIRDVSRSTFVKTLTEEKSVLLCPGGQEELVETYRYLRTTSKFMKCVLDLRGKRKRLCCAVDIKVFVVLQLNNKLHWCPFSHWEKSLLCRMHSISHFCRH